MSTHEPDGHRFEQNFKPDIDMSFLVGLKKNLIGFWDGKTQGYVVAIPTLDARERQVRSDGWDITNHDSN